jgi:hypothetical protein
LHEYAIGFVRAVPNSKRRVSIGAMSNALKRLQVWYETNCDGDWEHGYGIDIGNTDNPGWFIKVDLADTNLKNIDFQSVKYQNEHEYDWVSCRKSGAKFEGWGGPRKLEELLGIFLDWAEKSAR